MSTNKLSKIFSTLMFQKNQCL